MRGIAVLLCTTALAACLGSDGAGEGADEAQGSAGNTAMPGPEQATDPPPTTPPGSTEPPGSTPSDQETPPDQQTPQDEQDTPEQVILVPADAGTAECVDEDGDGYGPFCERGRDCDDADPEITDLCYRCSEPNEGCPCEPGAAPIFCDPEDQRVEMGGVMGTLVCDEGTRYCRDGVWSECELLLEYATFIPD